MTTAKTIAVFAIIFGCFAVLYPKIFHPMLLHLFGASPEKKTNDDILNRVPPHLRAGGGGKTGGMDDISKHMRSFQGGPHPGLRAAAEMKKQAAANPGSGRGMMSVVLPMYAIGIVVYLIYTLTKVFGKKDEAQQKSDDYLANHNPFQDIHYDPDQKKFVSGMEDMYESEASQYRKSKTKQRDLERLLLKADERNITENEMQQLKQRLMETESQMTRILQAMEAVQTRVGEAADQYGANAQEPENKSTMKNPDSPDMDTYEIINGNKESPVEEVGAKEKTEVKEEAKKETTAAHGYHSNAEEMQKTESDMYDAEDEEDEVSNDLKYDDDDIDEVMNDLDDEEDEGVEEDVGDAETKQEETPADEIIGQTEVTGSDHEQYPELRQRKAAGKDCAEDE